MSRNGAGIHTTTPGPRCQLTSLPLCFVRRKCTPAQSRYGTERVTAIMTPIHGICPYALRGKDRSLRGARRTRLLLSECPASGPLSCLRTKTFRLGFELRNPEMNDKYSRDGGKCRVRLKVLQQRKSDDHRFGCEPDADVTVEYLKSGIHVFDSTVRDRYGLDQRGEHPP